MADRGLTEKEPGRRQYTRYRTNIPATLTSDKGEFQINIIQISRAGCLVSPPTLQFTDPKLDLSFQDEELSFLRITGRIIYTIHNQGTGIAFSGLSEKERDAIERFFSGRGTHVA